MPRFCTHCGNEVAEGESHCMECGRKLPTMPPEQPSVPQFPPIQNQNLPRPHPTKGNNSNQIFNQNNSTNPSMYENQNNTGTNFNYSDYHRQFGPSGSPTPPLTPNYPSQSFVAYLFGLIFLRSDPLKKEFNTNSSKNAILLLILILIVNYFLYQAFFQLYPFSLGQDFLSNFISEVPDTSEIDFNSVISISFALYGLLYTFSNLIFGTILLGLVFNSNSVKNGYKRGFILSVSTFLPIVAIQILRYAIEFFLVQQQPFAVFELLSQTDVQTYLTIIFDQDLTHFPELRIVLLVIRIIWSFVLAKTLFDSSGLTKDKVLYYTVIFTALAGGGFDLIIQLLNQIY